MFHSREIPKKKKNCFFGTDYIKEIRKLSEWNSLFRYVDRENHDDTAKERVPRDAEKMRL